MRKAPVPTIFGMNFQAVSVGQKLIEGGVKGGYTDAAGTPTAAMQSEIQFVDAAIGQMVNELKKQGLLDSTLIIVTAKHGQSLSIRRGSMSQRQHPRTFLTRTCPTQKSLRTQAG